MTTVMRVLSRLMVVAVVVVALGQLMAQDAEAKPASGSTKSRTQSQRELCELEGGTFKDTPGGVSGFNSTSCTGGNNKAGDRHCQNTPRHTDCHFSRTSPLPSSNLVTDGRRAPATTSAADPARSEQPAITPLDEAEG